MPQRLATGVTDALTRDQGHPEGGDGRRGVERAADLLDVVVADE
jgi:hypothetical protein